MSLHRWNGRPAPAGLGLAATFLLILSGCGDKGGTVDDAVVLPSEPLAAPATGAGTATPVAAATAETTPTPAAPAAGAAEGWGTLKGRVVFDGTPPEPKPIEITKDPDVCGKHPHKSERLVVDPETKGVRFALVYIPKPTRVNPEAKAEKEKAPVEFDQNECVFEPHVLAAMKGEKIVLKSSDPVQHNIDARGLRVNSIYNSTLTSGTTIDYVPRAAERGPAEVVCDIHNWMKAYWLILDNPYFAVTDEKGNYEIKNVPADAQKVVVWQEAAAYVTPPAGESIPVKADGETTQDFKVEPGKLKGM